MRTIVLWLAVLALLVDCRSQKKVIKTEVATADTCSVSNSSTMAAERLRWMDSMTLNLDSFEIEWRMPQQHFADIGKMMGDTMQGSYSSSAVSVTDGFAHFTAQPQQASVVLRAKHASVGKVGRLERNSASCSQQADSVEAHRTSTADEHTTSESVQVAKPPDLTWLTWALLGALVFIIAIVLWLMEKEEEI